MCPVKKKASTPLIPDLVRTYLDGSPDCISILNPEGILEYCNPAHEKVFGYWPGDMVGLHFSDLPFFTREQAENFINLFAELNSIKRIDPIEVQAIRKDGETIWVETTVAPIEKDGRIFAMQSICRDITERVQTAEQLKKNAANIEQIRFFCTDLILKMARAGLLCATKEYQR